MKRIFFVFAAGLLSLALFSCKNNAGGPTILKPGDSVSVKKFKYSYVDDRLAPLPPADSEYKNDDDSVHIIVSLDLDLPEGNSILARRIREWVNEQISANNSQGPMYFEGDQNNSQAMADYYGNEIKKALEETIDPPIFNGYRDVEISTSKIFENPKCVTWMFVVEEYTGGAHGFHSCYGATFRKEDGRMFGHDIVSHNYADEQKLIPMVFDGLCEYFNATKEEVLGEYTDGSLREYLLPLPKYGPWFTSTGVDFQFQQYEIAAYAAGMPGFTIPYDKMEGLLSPAAADLLK
ncbi:MAG: DUF3298 domain-containing protein [Bacteroidales bacterium]|nr:DUF3298 domain-containing protein [Bacteroidales bacterium]